MTQYSEEDCSVSVKDGKSFGSQTTLLHIFCSEIKNI
jgi:hypothetical protein